jgi:hypothetical protein
MDVHPASDLDFLPIPDPGSKDQKSTGSRIRNTEKTLLKMKLHIKIKNRTATLISGLLLAE